MANAVFGFDRWTEDFTFSGGSWSGTYPVTNLNVLPLSRVGRTADAATVSTQWTATYSSGANVQLLGFVNHNASIDGLFRIRLYSDTGLTSLLHDTGWLEFWPIVYPWGSLPYGHASFWTGKYSAREIAGYNATRPVWLSQSYTVKGIRVEVDDTGNEDGYFQCGTFEIAEGYQLDINFVYGAQYGFRFRTQEQEALGGVKYFERRSKPRVFKGEVQYSGRDEVLSRAFEMLRRHDLNIPLLWVPNPDDTSHFLRNSYLARITDPGLFSFAVHNRDTMPIALEEVL